VSVVAHAHIRSVVRMAAAAEKRRRKAAKREEDAAKSALGRRIWKKRPYPFPPMGFWDWWEQDPGPPVPRWQARLNHRRSLPWHGWLWLDSHAQWLRLFTPRSFMTKAWRSMKRIRAAAAMRKELSR